MDSLSRIIQCFKPSECKHIRDYYLRKSNGSATKRLQLFDIVKNNFVEGNEATCRLIYNREPDSAFSQLKKRLKNDLLSFLIFFAAPKDDSSSIENINVECRKSYIQASVLLSRGETQEAEIILKRGLKLAEKYDITDLKIVVTDLLRTMSKGNSIDYAKYAQEVNKDMTLQSALLKAKAYNHSLTCSRPQKQLNGRNENIEKLRALYSETKSPNLGYWYYSTQMHDYRLQGNFKLAYLNGLRLLHLIETQPALYSYKNRIRVKNDLGRLLMVSKNRKRALIYIDKALHLCKPGCSEKLTIFDSLFLIHFGNGEFRKLDKIINAVFNNASLEQDSDQWNKWLFYQACQKFVSREFKESLSLLRKCVPICNEESGFFLEHRLVEILNLIELEEFDLLDYKLESLRKLIDYNKHLKTTRLRIVIRLCKSLVRNNYDFQRTYLEKEELINTISHCQQDFQLTELIDVNRWFRQKMKIFPEMAKIIKFIVFVISTPLY